MSKTTKRRIGASAFANPRLLLPVLVVVLGIGYYVAQWLQDGASIADRRARLLTDAAAELAKDEPDQNVLSQLMAGIKRQPDHQSAVELLAVKAEIELVRDRAERAYDLFGSVAASPGSSVADKRLGARIQLRRHESFGGDRAAAAAMLQQVRTFSERAYEDGSDPADLFRAWQACKRAWAHEAATEIAGRLTAAHADSPQARLVQLAAKFDPSQQENQVIELELDFVNTPAELQAMRTLVVLMSGDVPEAVRLADMSLNRAPGVWTVRFFAAIVYDACRQGSAADSADRETWLARRDAQIDWLLQRSPQEESMRDRWSKMRQSR